MLAQCQTVRLVAPAALARPRATIGSRKVALGQHRVQAKSVKSRVVVSSRRSIVTHAVQPPDQDMSEAEALSQQQPPTPMPEAAAPPEAAPAAPAEAAAPAAPAEPAAPTAPPLTQKAYPGLFDMPTAGTAQPMGATLSADGVNFAVYAAPECLGVHLCIWKPEDLKAGKDPTVEIPLDPTTNRTGNTWHIHLPKASDQMLYGYRVNGQKDQHKGHHFDWDNVLLDPYAKAVLSGDRKKYGEQSTACAVGEECWPQYAGAVPSRTDNFDWEGVTSPNYTLSELCIYESHVRGLTAQEGGGTYDDIIPKLPYFKRMGFNALELLPMHEFNELEYYTPNPVTGEMRYNFWGYSTVNFFSPKQLYAKSAGDDCGRAANKEFKTLVKECHRNGIEVILDVVFNHTAEGTWGESNWHSQSAVAKSKYYLLSQGKDTNYTGCGNTMNANDGVCADWICECLRYWVSDMHVDGFRFDLASSLCRGGDGKIQHEPHLIKKMLNDPVLSRAKLIAEPWDCSWPDGYLVGKFPSCGTTRWAEWNGVWRDTVRSFIKGEPCMKSEFATRMCGSSDLYRHDGRSPFHSVNFITAHDGFTLYDLVSYNDKQNICNGENSGDDHNNSWNCGHEGHTGDSNIIHLRDRQMRNFLAALFLSIGTPMMVFGDEYGRTQHGCNNGWCQDKLSWFSWDGCSKQESRLLRFCRLLIAFRKRNSRVFCRKSFLSEKDIWWRTYWDDEYSYLCWVLHDNHDGKYDGILIAFNAGHETRSCDLPSNNEWYRIVDTNLPSPKDICEDEKSATKIGGGNYAMAPRSCIVLKCFADKAGAYDAKLEKDYLDQQRLEDHLESIAKRRMSMEFDMKRTLSRVSFSRQVSDVEAEETWQRTMSQSLMKRQSMMSGFILETTGADGETEFVVQRPDGHQVPMIRPPLEKQEKQAAAEPRAIPAVPPPLLGEAAVKKKADAEAAARKKAEAEAAAKKKADEEAVAKKKVCFKVTCEETKPGEGVFIVGSSQELGAWDSAKGIACTTTPETFPVWTSEPVSTQTAAEFKIVVQHAERRDGARWESSGNKAVEGAALAGADSLTLSCSWGSLEVTAARA